MPRQRPTGQHRRHSADRVLNVQYSNPVILAAPGTVAGTAFDTEDPDNLTIELALHYSLVTALTGTNNDISLIARVPGAPTTPIRLTLIDPPGNNVALSVAVVGGDINVTLATDGASAITTTAAQLVAAINASAAARDLVVAALAAGNDGTGVVTALAQTALADLAASSATMTVQTMADEENWYAPPGPTIAAQSTAGSDAGVYGPVGWQTRINVAVTGTVAVSTPVIAHND